jgi:hypothetical protein
MRDRTRGLNLYPLLDEFDTDAKPLSAEEARGADFETRVRSVGKFLIAEARRIHLKLSPEGRSNYDPEDIFQEIVLELRTKDHAYDPSKGRYITFAAYAVRNVEYHVACRARPVKVPENSSKRLDPRNNPDPRLLAAARDHEDVQGLLLQDRRPGPLDGLIWLEEIREGNERVAELIANCTVIECLALSSLGTSSGSPQAPKEVALSHGIDPARLRKAMVTARQKVRETGDREHNGGNDA